MSQEIDHILTLKEERNVSLNFVLQVTVSIDIFSRPLKVLGYQGQVFQGFIMLKTYRKLFLNVNRTQNPLVIQLYDAEYDQIILGVTNPAVLAQQINKAAQADQQQSI